MSRPAALKQADRVSFGTSRNRQHRLKMRNDKDGLNLRQRAGNSVGAVVKAKNSKVD